jgi:hypothetical protein
MEKYVSESPSSLLSENMWVCGKIPIFGKGMVELIEGYH